MPINQKIRKELDKAVAAGTLRVYVSTTTGELKWVDFHSPKQKDEPMGS